MKSRGDSKPIPQGLVARVAAGLRYAMTGSAPDVWFGPLEPLDPLAPPETAGRQFDYPTGYNVVTEPRANEAISFRELRALADGYDVLRLVIETRKDQLVNLAWEIKPRDKAKAGANDPRIQEVTEFLAYPDREHTWEQWLRMLVEDMLVLDAATLYPRRTNGGQLYALEPIDGATIKRVLDPWGRTPQPPEPAYQQVLKGLPAVDYTTDQVLYLPRNVRTNRIYGFSPVEQVLMSVNIAIRRQVHQLNYFTEGNIPEALIGVPETWTVKQIREFQEYWDALLEGNLAQRRHARFVPGSIAKNYVATKEPGLKDEYDEWLTRIVCYAFSVSNQWAIKQMNRATADTAQEQALQEGLGPLKIWIKGMIDRLLTQVWGYPDLELGWHEEEAVDPLVQAQVSDVYLRNGTFCLNDVLLSLGLPPIPGGEVHRIYTPTGAVPLNQVDNPPAPPSPPIGHNGGPPLDDATGKEDPAAKAGELGKAAPRLDRDRPAIGRLRSRLEELLKAHLAEQRRTAARQLGERFGRVVKAAESDGSGTGDGASARPDLPEAAAAGIAEAEAAQGEGKSSAAAIEAAIDAVLGASPGETIIAMTAGILQDAAIDGIQEGLAALTAAASEAGAPIEGASLSSATSLANPRAVAWAAEYAAGLVGGIDDVTRKALNAAIVNAEEKGSSVAQLAAEIQQLTAFSPARAALIAQHELAKADIAGNLAGWRAAQDELGLVIRKRWILGLEDNHCEICLGNARDGAIDLDEPFSSGNQSAPAHPRCMCDLVPETGPVAAKFAKAFNPRQPRDGKGRWTAGDAYDAEHETLRGRSAMDHVIHHQADVHGAMLAPGLGPVSFVWGKPGNAQKGFKGGFGVSKIIAKRSTEGHDGTDVARKLPEVIAKGSYDKPYGPQGAQRVNVTHDGHTAVLSEGGPHGMWLLTGWKA